MTRTMRRLTESGRLLGNGRDIQRRLDIRIIKARSAAHRADTNNITAKLIADELDELVLAINAATK